MEDEQEGEEPGQWVGGGGLHHQQPHHHSLLVPPLRGLRVVSGPLQEQHGEREAEPTDTFPGNVIVKFSIQDKILFILSTIILHSISK